MTDPVEGETQSEEPGPLTKEVVAYIERLGNADVGIRGSFKEMALKLARAFDQCQTADIAELAKISSELRQTLGNLRDSGAKDSNTLADVFKKLSAPDAPCPRCGYQA